jgi:ribosomal protein S18 acetylase RimI-like enzyme
MAVREDGWLSERFGHPVLTVECGTPEDEVRGHLDRNGRRTYQARVPAADAAAVRMLSRLGFSVVDATLTLGRRPAAGEPEPRVVHSEPAHREAVVGIAATAFRYSRFHLDPAVSRTVADRIKADWIESYFAGTRGEHLLVALENGSPAGFLAVIASAEDGRALRTIDLIAVAEAARGQGLARALTGAFVAESAAVCDEVRVGTQAANVPATRLYESLGFSLVRAEYALHLHVEGPA